MALLVFAAIAALVWRFTAKLWIRITLIAAVAVAMIVPGIAVHSVGPTGSRTCTSGCSAAK